LPGTFRPGGARRLTDPANDLGLVPAVVDRAIRGLAVP
jgi:hypothetical protein